MGLRLTTDLAETFAKPTSAQLRVTTDLAEVFAQPTSAQLRLTADLVEVFTQNVVAVHDISSYLRDALANHMFRGAPYAKPTSIWLALYSTPPTIDGGGTEVAGNAYARVQCGPSDVAWAGPTAGNGIATSLLDFVFPTPTADWGLLSAWAIFDAATGGNLLVFSTFSTSTFVAAGTNPRFVAGSLTVTFQ